MQLLMQPLYQPFQPTLTDSGLQSLGLSLQQTGSSKTLKHLIHSYIQINADRPTPYPVVPDGTQAIYIGIGGSLMSGTQQKACDVQLFEPGQYFGIRFYPGALRHFFDLNLQEITNQFVDTGFIPCSQFATLHERIYQQPTFLRRAKVCEQWLLMHLNSRPFDRFDQALAFIFKSSGAIRIERLAAEVGWSSRHLNRMFRRHTGLSTQSFSQTIRFQHACKQLYSAPGNTLDTAIELGYFDQSHLLNDYKKYLHRNPSIFADRFKSDFYNP